MMRRVVRIALDWLRIARGWIVYALTGTTPAFAYQIFVRQFCNTGGRSNDLLAALASRFSPPYRLPNARGLLGDFSAGDLAQISACLDRDGYYVFPTRLPEDLCRRLADFALQKPCVIREDESSKVAAGARAIYAAERGAPRGVRYDFDMGDVIANADVQALICDLSILSVAQTYLGARPIADVLALWWSTAFNARPSSAAAQYFHFDLDRIKWLKVFVYLTDVGPENGPHTFVAGSHRSGAIADRLLQRGYVRLSDEDVRSAFPDPAFIEFCAPRGTVLMEDTRGLHKGRRVERGDRLMLQLQFSNSLFGATYPQVVLPEASRSAQEREFSHAFPSVFSFFHP